MSESSLLRPNKHSFTSYGYTYTDGVLTPSQSWTVAQKCSLGPAETCPLVLCLCNSEFHSLSLLSQPSPLPMFYSFSPFTFCPGNPEPLLGTCTPLTLFPFSAHSCAMP